MNILSGLYGRVMELSRATYERPGRQRQLSVPVISVGNVAAGGSGKTPIVAALARLLRDSGRRPAILSRGYARRVSADGVVVVSDGASVLQPVQASGDEPQMLARALPGVRVLVCADRHLAGRLAEDRLGADVCILDDGFQHWQLARDVDLVLVGAADVSDRLLPAGRLREPVASARRADAVLAPEEEVAVVAGALNGVLPAQTLFQVRRMYPAARLLRPFGAPATFSAVQGGNRTAVAVAGIARPERFYAAAEAQGWDLREKLAFRDHHWFSAGDVARVETAADAAGAATILTTEKDAVRLESLVTSERWAYLPMEVAIEPADAFRDWLLSRIRG